MEECRESPEKVELKSSISGSELRGGTNTVEREPLLVSLRLLCIEVIVRMEPVGERVTDAESGTVIGRLTASLYASNPI